MKKRILFLSMILSMLIMVSCNKSDNINREANEINIDEKSQPIVKITVADAKKLIDNTDVIFVDLRTVEEYIGWAINSETAGHIKNAIDFPKEWFSILSDDGKLEKELIRRDITKDRELILYDTADVDIKVIERLSQLGYENISLLDKGIEEWTKNENLPIDKMKNHEMLVYPQWVEDLVNDKNPDTYDGRPYVILELSFGKEEAKYKKGHIKGAIHIDDSLNHIPGPRVLSDYEFIPLGKKEKFWNRPDDKVIEEKLLNLGITKDTMVIIYGPNATAASRCAVVMKYAGVEDVRLLNGGIQRWNLDKLPLEEGINNPTPAKDFGTKIPARPDILIDLDDELKIVEDPNSVVASIRSWAEYIGDVSGYTYIGEAGEIANSRFGYAGSDPYHMEDFRNIDDTMFNYHIIEERWKKWGITPNKRISFHCGTGWRASETYLYALAMGWEDICVYDGGWYEWHLRKDTPRQEKGTPVDTPETPVLDY